MKKIFTTSLFCLAMTAAVASIDASDSVLINLDNFIKVGNNIAVPVSILTDDTIYSLDFSFKYNHNNVEYDTIVNQTVYIQPLSYYNSVDSTVRFTSFSSQPYATGVTLVYVHFDMLAWQLTSTDLFSLNAYLNGDPCTFLILGGIPSGLEEYSLEGLKLYPNPASGNVVLEIPAASTVEWFDVSGQLFMRENLATGRHTIPTGTFSAGIYFVKVRHEDTILVRKLVIQ